MASEEFTFEFTMPAEFGPGNQHSLDCFEYNYDVYKFLLNFRNEFPNYCRCCKGTGEIGGHSNGNKLYPATIGA